MCSNSLSGFRCAVSALNKLGAAECLLKELPAALRSLLQREWVCFWQQTPAADADAAAAAAAAAGAAATEGGAAGGAPGTATTGAGGAAASRAAAARAGGGGEYGGSSELQLLQQDLLLAAATDKVFVNNIFADVSSSQRKIAEAEALIAYAERWTSIVEEVRRINSS